jgi:uncharacterized protein (UPF0261 family)
MQALPIGIPKLMVSTMASGDVSGYIGASDIAIMNSVTDISGLNRISRKVLKSAANQIAGAVVSLRTTAKPLRINPRLASLCSASLRPAYSN